MGYRSITDQEYADWAGPDVDEDETEHTHTHTINAEGRTICVYCGEEMEL